MSRNETWTFIEEKIKYKFKNEDLLIRALTHKSVFRKKSFNFSEKEELKEKLNSSEKSKKNVNLKEVSLKKKTVGHNERLEFLGDAVLNLSIAHLLMESFPFLSEGNLSKIRAALVSEKSLANISRELELNLKLRVGEESKKSKLTQEPRLQASVFEALVGAYFLDSSYKKVNVFITRIFKNLIKRESIKTYLKMDYKSNLQEKLQKKYKVPPEYVLDKEHGPDHKKTFFVKVYLEGKCLGSGKGQSKKEAEQEAAKKILMSL